MFYAASNWLEDLELPILPDEILDKLFPKPSESEPSQPRSLTLPRRTDLESPLPEIGDNQVPGIVQIESEDDSEDERRRENRSKNQEDKPMSSPTEFDGPGPAADDQIPCEFQSATFEAVVKVATRDCALGEVSSSIQKEELRALARGQSSKTKRSKTKTSAEGRKRKVSEAEESSKRAKVDKGKGKVMESSSSKTAVTAKRGQGDVLRVVKLRKPVMKFTRNESLTLFRGFCTKKDREELAETSDLSEEILEDIDRVYGPEVIPNGDPNETLSLALPGTIYVISESVPSRL